MLHSTQCTIWRQHGGIEKHDSEVFAYAIFNDFQTQMIAARVYRCVIDTATRGQSQNHRYHWRFLQTKSHTMIDQPWSQISLMRCLKLMASFVILSFQFEEVSSWTNWQAIIYGMICARLQENPHFWCGWHLLKGKHQQQEWSRDAKIDFRDLQPVGKTCPASCDVMVNGWIKFGEKLKEMVPVFQKRKKS